MQHPVDGGSFTLFAQPFTLGEGSHVIRYQSQDNAGNIEPVNVSTIAVDATPPVTLLVVSSGPFISTSTLFNLQSQDPLSNGVASAIKQTFISISKITPALTSVYGNPFILTSGGTHTLQWYSQDNVGNTEVVESTTVTVFVDTAPPTTSLSYSTAPFVNGISYISSATTIALNATCIPARQPLAWLSYSTPSMRVSLSPTLRPLPSTKASIPSATRVRTMPGISMFMSTVAVDATPPITSIAYSSVTYLSGAVLLSTFTKVSLAAADPLSQGMASGVKQTFVSIDTSAFQIYGSSFVLTSTGTHTLAWYSQDNVGNKEVTRSTTVVVQSMIFPSASPLSFVQSKTLGTIRNDYTGWVGFKFTVGFTPIQLSSIGRIDVAGNTGTHSVKLVDAEGFDVPGASVSVVTTSGTTNQFHYSPLSSSVIFSSGAFLLPHES